MSKPIILIVALMMASCQPPVPKNVLPPAEMQSVMWDMMQADAMAEYYTTRDSALTELAKHVNNYQIVLAIHKISKEDFKRSLSYYQAHPSKLKTIFDSLQTFTERTQTTDTIKKPHHPVVPDSIKKKMAASL